MDIYVVTVGYEGEWNHNVYHFQKFENVIKAFKREVKIYLEEYNETWEEYAEGLSVSTFDEFVEYMVKFERQFADIRWEIVRLDDKEFEKGD